MIFKKIAIMLFILLSGCTHLTSRHSDGHDHGYIIESTSLVTNKRIIFTPILISGDGLHVVVDTRNGVAFWTKQKGISWTYDNSGALGCYPDAINDSGTVVAGGFGRGQVILTEYGFCIWNQKTGTRLLDPHFSSSDGGIIFTSIKISPDGQRLSFFCDDQSAIYFTCNSGPFPDPAPWAEKIWYQNKVYNLFYKFKEKFDYIQIAGDFQTYIVGTFHPMKFGRLTQDGTYTPLENFPKNFSPDAYKFIMNTDASVIALKSQYSGVTLIWHDTGELFSQFALPRGCNGFDISNIDDNGNLFGETYCSTLSPGEFVSIRVAHGHGETIHKWLRKDGVQNNLSIDTSISLVSANGKTVYGETDMTPAVSGVKNNDNNGLKYFIAHTP